MRIDAAHRVIFPSMAGCTPKSYVCIFLSACTCCYTSALGSTGLREISQILEVIDALGQLSLNAEQLRLRFGHGIEKELELGR
jgi:hypothetical protein